VKWYRDNLDARVLYKDKSWAILNCHGANIALTLSKQHPPHIGFELDSMKEFPNPELVKYHRDGVAYLYVDDIDGNTIEYVYRPGRKS
tara:strand:+ start:2237 stop:2500 length:264 start_codon:yes stop_codon:yes gene_type:complete